MIRLYLVDDGKILGEMLLEEGIEPDDMGFAKHETYIYDDGEIKGFYTMRFEHGLPYIIHFCVGKKWRDTRIVRAMIRDFAERFRRYGTAILNVPEKRDDIQKIVEWFFKAKPYACKEGHLFYKVEV